MKEEEEEELLPPPRPGSSAAAAGASGRAADGKPASKTFLPLEDDEDDMGIIPDEEQIRYGARHAEDEAFHSLSLQWPSPVFSLALQCSVTVHSKVQVFWPSPDHSG